MIGSTPHANSPTPTTDAPDAPDTSWDRVVGEFRRSLLGARLAESLASSEHGANPFPEPSRTDTPSGIAGRIAPL